ncbi:MAG: hypothetical protein JNM01_15260 [Delftia acidovorans]|nr:hypothetical protein [Delftia acidovorans]
MLPFGLGQTVRFQPLQHMELALLGHEQRAARNAIHAAALCLQTLRPAAGMQARHQGHDGSQSHRSERPPGCSVSASALPAMRRRVHEDRTNDSGPLHWHSAAACVNESTRMPTQKSIRTWRNPLAPFLDFPRKAIA